MRREEALLAARRRMQEELDADVERYKEKQKQVTRECFISRFVIKPFAALGEGLLCARCQKNRCLCWMWVVGFPPFFTLLLRFDPYQGLGSRFHDRPPVMRAHTDSLSQCLDALC